MTIYDFLNTAKFYGRLPLVEIGKEGHIDGLGETKRHYKNSSEEVKNWSVELTDDNSVKIVINRC